MQTIIKLRNLTGGRRLLFATSAYQSVASVNYTTFHYYSLQNNVYQKQQQQQFNKNGLTTISRQAYSTSKTINQQEEINNFSDAEILKKFSDKKVYESLPKNLQQFLFKNVKWLNPDRVHICDGSLPENAKIIRECENLGIMKPLKKLENCYITRTDPADVARVESKTVISTESERETVCIPTNGQKTSMGNWISPEKLQIEVDNRFPNCMKGRTMYVIPFSMGPAASPLSKIGVQLTDSPYVVASMRIMTRMGKEALDALKSGERDFVKCIHSVGQPLPASRPFINNWPCNPEKVIIAHIPKNNEILSFGSGYGGNSLLGKKCLALRLGSILARREGWLAEHMLILGITNPEGKKKYIAAAFPSACGKTNLAMLQPTIPGYKIECVGDDIAWMKFDSEGKLRAINPENGFFGVAPGTSMQTNPNAMKTMLKNTVFTNVAETNDSGVYWEGLEDEVDVKNLQITDWLNRAWQYGKTKTPAAHPNSRFCAPASQCPIIDSSWQDPNGVHIEAILFGGRRPQGVPLVYQANSWNHGVFIGAAMRSEATAAAEHQGKVIMHDPFAMRPFFGYNFGDYLKHWLSFGEKTNLQLPKIFHVNWFRKSEQGKFLWPGFGDNIRVLDWIFRRVDGKDESIAKSSAIGFLPTEQSFNVNGLESYKHLNMNELFSLPKSFWQQEMKEIKVFLQTEVGKDLPVEILQELEKITLNVEKL